MNHFDQPSVELPDPDWDIPDPDWEWLMGWFDETLSPEDYFGPFLNDDSWLEVA